MTTSLVKLALSVLKPVMAMPPSTSSVVNMLSGEGSACMAGAAGCVPVSGVAAGGQYGVLRCCVSVWGCGVVCVSGIAGR